MDRTGRSRAAVVLQVMEQNVSVSAVTTQVSDTVATQPDARRRLPTDRDRRLRRIVTEHYAFIWRCLRHLGVTPNDADHAAEEVLKRASQMLELAHLQTAEESVGVSTSARAVSNRLPSSRTHRERARLFGTVIEVAARWRSMRATGSASPEFKVGVRQLVSQACSASDRAPARALLDSILEGMPLEMRAIFMLYEVEQFAIAEIATLLDWPAGKVAFWLRHAREYFRNTVARLEARRLHRRGAR